MLICGDIHGEIEKLKAFLKYKVSEPHLFLGDFLDSFTALDDEIIKCLRLAIKSDAVLLWGNHEIHYLPKPVYYCSGFRSGIAKTVKNMLMKSLDRWNLAYTHNKYVFTHAGVSKELFDIKSPVRMTNYLNKMMKRLLNGENYDKRIYAISKHRGGYGPNGGPLWFDHRYEKLSNNFKQVFGHTESYDVVYIGKHLCINCKKYICFNSNTHKIENFGD